MMKKGKTSISKTTEMNKLKTGHYVLLIAGIIGVVFGPWLFTRQYHGDWSFFDFSQTGQIGDTIGGITAPIVGLVSIFLLWWTFRAQLKFNEDQEKINKEQKKFNDASRVLSMQTQVMQIDDSIRYGFSTADRVHEGRGSASLRNLQKGTSANVRMPYEILISLIDRVHMLDVSVSSLVNVANTSKLTDDEKKSTTAIALVYIEDILVFYEMAYSHNIEYLLPINEVGNELIDLPTAQETISAKTRPYAEKIRAVREVCNSIVG